MSDPTRSTIEEDTIRSNDDIKVKMARRKVKLERELRAKLPTDKWYGAIKRLMSFGVATADDWNVVAENIGRANAMKQAEDMGFPIDSDNNMDIKG